MGISAHTLLSMRRIARMVICPFWYGLVWISFLQKLIMDPWKSEKSVILNILESTKLIKRKINILDISTIIILHLFNLKKRNIGYLIFMLEQPFNYLFSNLVHYFSSSAS